MTEESKYEFIQESMRSRRSLPREVFQLLRYNKKWWMLPLIVVMLLFTALMILASSAAGPFIYSLY